MGFKSLVVGCAVAASLSFGGAAQAVENPSFEAGLTDWTATWTPVDPLADPPAPDLVRAVSGTSSALGNTYGPKQGASFAELEAGAQDLYSTLSQDIVFSFRTLLSLDAAFLGFDYLNFPGDSSHNDDAYVRLINLDTMIARNLFVSNMLQVDSYGETGWTSVGRTFFAGSYRLEVGVRNIGDSDPDYASRLLVDNITTAASNAPVPEPGTWALMIVGFGAAGAALRANRRRVLA